MLTEYAADIKTAVAYPPAPWLTPSASGWRKTTKLSYVFRNRKICPRYFLLQRWRRRVVKGEDRILINSPKVATYDLQRK